MGSDEAHGDSEHRQRQHAAATTSESQIASCERQAPQFAERFRHSREIAAQHHYIARLDADCTHSLGDPFPAAAHCQQVDTVALVEPNLRWRATDEKRLIGDYRLHDPDLVGRRIARPCRSLARQLELGLVDNPLEGSRLAFDEQDIIRPDHRIIRGGKVASAFTHDHGHLDSSSAMASSWPTVLSMAGEYFGTRASVV